MEWRVLPEFPRYEVSEAGEVRRVRDGRLLRGNLTGNGRIMMKLRDWEHKPRAVLRSHLIAAAFLGPRPGSPDEIFVCHKDANRANDHWRNLYYGTQIENMADRERHGNTLRGERHGRSKLTSEQVDAVRKRCGGRIVATEVNAIAAELKVSKTLIRLILKGECWRGPPQSSARTADPTGVAGNV